MNEPSITADCGFLNPCAWREIPPGKQAVIHTFPEEHRCHPQLQLPGGSPKNHWAPSWPKTKIATSLWNQKLLAFRSCFLQAYQSDHKVTIITSPGEKAHALVNLLSFQKSLRTLPSLSVGRERGQHLSRCWTCQDSIRASSVKGTKRN